MKLICSIEVNYIMIFIENRVHGVLGTFIFFKGVDTTIAQIHFTSRYHGDSMTEDAKEFIRFDFHFLIDKISIRMP